MTPTPPIRRTRTVAAALGCCAALTVTAACDGAGGTEGRSAVDAGATAHAKHYTGELADGAQWVADVPDDFNGTLMLFSHGYGPLKAANAPNAKTREALLERGYALVGSSYSGSSRWALNVAVKDQFATLDAVKKKVGKVGDPERTIAWGESMGGLINSLIAQHGEGRIDGALSACGILAGGVDFNNYQVDGDYAVAQLLAAGEEIKLTGFTSDKEAAASGEALARVVQRAQSTSQGRARTALAAALRNQPNWFSGKQPPTAHDYGAREKQQAEGLIKASLPFTLGARYQVEKAEGGRISSNVGVDYARLLSYSSDLPQVRALYKKAGLDLDEDLRKLTRDARIEADPDAVRRMRRTAVPSGHLPVPNLTLHTTDDPLNPAPQESEYARTVRGAGDRGMLRQTYVQGTGHCTFEPANWLAALNALEHRVDSGSWGTATEPRKLNDVAKGTGEGGFPPFIRYTAPELVGARGRAGAR
ncbi:alpha/beta hydrolase [Streptomyces piniterrae]|uniref:Alpha/beta hydrolase n=1 Tax=Streptomyces piniterrae TaxID=2571125 RepID=A0A4U0NS54_9ACTN|nr:alpha/beta hydrolase [Streptomyces piniterrae]TJZ56842.1 alpha/beta hydrolase [Streptomyces piniterrae]